MIEAEPSQQNDGPSWLTVRTGLCWQIVGVILLATGSFGTAVSIAVVAIAGTADPERGNIAGFIALCLTMLLFSLGGICLLIGSVFCCAAPSEGGARATALGAAISTILSGYFLFSAVSNFFLYSETMGLRSANPIPYMIPLAGTAVLLGLAASAFGACFLTALGRRFGSPSMAASANAFLIIEISLFAMTAALATAMLAMGRVPSQGDKIVFAIIAIVLVLVSVIVVVYSYLKLLLSARRLIEEGLYPSRALPPPPPRHPLD